MIKSSSKLGKNQEHLKLTVEDENGTVQQVLWWGGGGEELPSGKFDLAYTLRASDWRGVHQAQLELVDFRVLEAEKIDVKSKKLEVVDYRKVENGKEILSTFDFPYMLWAEGVEKKSVNGFDRLQLKPAETLVVWTIPPSPEELRAAVKAVRPGKIILFGIDPGADEPKAFIERLAGLIKFVLSKKAGQTTLSELAAATAQKVAAVRFGLEWLSKRGQVSVEYNGDKITLSVVPAVELPEQRSNGIAAETAFAHLSFILRETAAYREHFKRADFHIEELELL
jgi:single-stranded-DNA-specific exonuclease